MIKVGVNLSSEAEVNQMIQRTSKLITTEYSKLRESFDQFNELREVFND